MKQNTKLTNKKFSDEGADWYSDRYVAVKVERNRYLLLLVLCFVALMLSILANVLLSPLKTVVPYVIQVDKSTGITTVVERADVKVMQQKEAVTTYFLLKYLNARMSYDYGLRRNNADVVRALSTANTYRDYVNQIDASNPKSPVQLYKDNARVVVSIKSISFPYPDIATIHFSIVVQSNLNQIDAKPVVQDLMATIKYTYADVSLSLSDRENINPIGFFVTNFQLNQETLGTK